MQVSARLEGAELAPEWQVTEAVADRYPNYSICGDGAVANLPTGEGTTGPVMPDVRRCSNVIEAVVGVRLLLS
jgi:hypothetical protein